MIEFRPVTEYDIDHVAINMRQADINEVWASSRATPLEALQRSVALSEFACSVYINGEPQVILGLVKCGILSRKGVPWLLGTEHALKHRREFLKQAPIVIEEMLTICSYLFNHVHVENRESVRWLKWLGFELEDPIPHGPHGELFQLFHMGKYNV